MNKSNRKVERELQREIAELEKKYHAKHTPFFEKRKDIVLGVHEPSQAECERTEEELEDEDEMPEAPSDGADIKGIPSFWATCLKNLPPFAELISAEDDEALKHLIDVRYSYLKDQPGFVLEFEFEENEYFSNILLTKSYYLMDSDEALDFVYDHAEGLILWLTHQNCD